MCHNRVVSKLPDNKGFNEVKDRTGNTFWSKIDSFELSATKVAVAEGWSGTFIAECEHRQDHFRYGSKNEQLMELYSLAACKLLPGCWCEGRDLNPYALSSTSPSN